VLKEVLYIPIIDTSLVSMIRYYAAGGTLIKERLYSVNRACCGLLDFKRHGFFLQLKGLPTPKLSGPCLHYSYPIEVQIPYKDPEQYRDYIPISPSDSEASSPDTGPMPNTELDQQLEQGPDPLVLDPSEASEIQGEPNIGPLASDLTQGLIEPNPLSQPPKQPTEYQELLELAILWHARLGHIGLGLLKKTAKITEALPDFTAIKSRDFYCQACIRAKATRVPSKDPIPDPPRALDRLEGDTFKIKPTPYNRKPVCLLLVDRKTRYRWVFNLPNKEGKTLSTAIIGFFRSLKNTYNRYPLELHFNGGTEITGDLQT